MSRLSALLCICILLVSSPKPTLGQTVIDSLLQVRKTAGHDTLAIRADIQLGMAFENSDFDSALFYYNRALELAGSDYTKVPPKFKGIVLGNLGFAYIYAQKQVKEGISYLKTALASHASAGLVNEMNKTQFNIGFFYGSLSEYDSAIFHYNQVIDRHEVSKQMNRLHESYNNAGLTYYYKGEYALSARYITKALKLKEETGETEEINHSYINLASTFNELGEFEKAKLYNQKSNAINEARADKDRLATGLRNIADILIKQDSLSEALRFLSRAFELNRETDNQAALSLDFNIQGHLYEKKGEYTKALESYEEARNRFGNVNDRYGSSVLTSLGRIKLKLLDEAGGEVQFDKKPYLKEVINLGQDAWSLASRSDLINRKLESSELLKAAYQASGDLKRSLQYADTAFKLTNIVNSQAQSQSIAAAAIEYETERIENENTLLQQTQQTQAAQLKQQNTLIYGAIVVLLLLVIIAALIYRSRLNLKKANLAIEKSLSEKELLLKEIHHRVKNNLQVVSSLLDLQSRGIEDEEALATFMEGQNRVKAMALIHQKLYQNQNLATIDFADYAENLMKELASIYPSAAMVKTSIKAETEAQFDIDTAVPLGLILNELISNAYKYAFEGNGAGELNVSVESLGEGKYQLTVSDSGAGLPEGFDFKKAKSLGLRLVRRLSKQLFGSVTYSYEAGAKFVVIFTDTLERKAI